MLNTSKAYSSSDISKIKRDFMLTRNSFITDHNIIDDTQMIREYEELRRLISKEKDFNTDNYKGKATLARLRK